MRAPLMLTAAAAWAVASTACGSAEPPSTRTAQEQANLDMVVEFYNAALNEKNADKAASYLGDVYTQHNPAAKDGSEGLVGFIGYLKSKFPENESEIKRAFVDGDHVFLHVHTKREPEQLGMAVMEIFRVEDGKVVEHWDVQQAVPETSANDNTMF